MTLRPESQIGFLMLQWLGVLVPNAFREEVQSWRGLWGRHSGRRSRMAESLFGERQELGVFSRAEVLAAIDRVASQPTPVGSIREKLGPAPSLAARAQRLVETMSERLKPADPHQVFLTCPICGGPATKADLDDPHGCCDDCYWKLPDGGCDDRLARPELYWPTAQAMLRGDPPPEEFQRAVLAAGIETGSAVIAVDPEAGTVTVGTERPLGPRWYGCLPDEAHCMTCSRLRRKNELRIVMPGEGVYRGKVPWVECIARDENGECLPGERPFKRIPGAVLRVRGIRREEAGCRRMRKSSS